MNHVTARPAVAAAFKAQLGREGTLSELQHLQAVCYHESRYGTAWSTPEGRKSNNWGAVQYQTPTKLGLSPANSLAPHPSRLTDGSELPYPRISPDGKGFLAVDSSPGKGWYWMYFRRYPTASAGAEHTCKVMYVDRPTVLVAATCGDTYSVSAEMRRTVYYEGFGATVQEQIAGHYRAISKHILAISKLLGEPLPDGSLPPPQTIKLGSSGEAVRTWQGILNEWAEDDRTIVADGIFGPLTERLTKAWQRAHSLKDDGIVGPMTWAKAQEEQDEEPAPDTQPAPPSLKDHEDRIQKLEQWVEAIWKRG